MRVYLQSCITCTYQPIFSRVLQSSFCKEKKELKAIFFSKAYLQLSNFMSNLKQGINTTSDLLRENERLDRELINIKTELYQLYQENLKLRQIVKQQQSDKHFYKDCENQIARLKVLVNQNNQKRKDIPNEREEIKDRIIMKLEDQLIKAQLELSKLHRHR